MASSSCTDADDIQSILLALTEAMSQCPLEQRRTWVRKELINWHPDRCNRASATAVTQWLLQLNLLQVPHGATNKFQPVVLNRCFPEHKPVKRGVPPGTEQMYCLFSAASAGCLGCVRYFVEKQCVNYRAESEFNKYTAYGYACYSQASQSDGVRAVKSYLKTYYYHDGIPLPPK